MAVSADIASCVQQFLRSWRPDATAEEAFARMVERWPGLVESSLEEDVLPRLKQLQHLVNADVLTGVETANLTIAQPKILSAYKIREVWREGELVAVDKPFDMRIDVPKGQEKRWEDEVTVADWFMATFPGQRVRFCHQLDHATSGVLLMASSKAAGRLGSQCFEMRKAKKTYLALVLGVPDWPLGEEVVLKDRLRDRDDDSFARTIATADEPGEEAETSVRLLRTGLWPKVPTPEVGDNQQVRASLVECRPFTGRRHQIRLHLMGSGIPILGDDTYGGRPFGESVSGCYRMFLHALRLELPLAKDGEMTCIEASCGFSDELATEGTASEP